MDTDLPGLRRLDDLVAVLARRRDVIAVVGLGSSGVEIDCFDEHSDLDLFLIVDDGAVERYADSVDWLEACAAVAFHVANDRNGRKVLFDDQVFVEFAAFTLDELARIPFQGARILWRRADAPDGLATWGAPPPAPPFDTVEFHLGEALTNLYVGLHREIRGERLTAMRFIQCFAVDHLIALLRLTQPSIDHRQDPFEPTRRIEHSYPPHLLPLSEIVRGYDGNVEAARTILEWLRTRFEVDPAMEAAIGALLPPAVRARDVS